MAGGGTGDTGGDADNGSDSGWSSENSGTLWGWLSGIVDGLETVWKAVTNLPQLISDKLGSFFTQVKDAVLSLPERLKGFFTEVKDAVLSLPLAILDGIRAIFIPDSGYIEDSFDSFLSEMKMKFNLDTSAFENLFQGEEPVSDVYVDYGISGVGNFNLKVFDTSFLAQGISYFRPIIRGFLVLMMLLYHVKQLIGFFGYDSGVVGGRSDHIRSAKESQRSD